MKNAYIEKKLLYRKVSSGSVCKDRHLTHVHKARFCFTTRKITKTRNPYVDTPARRLTTTPFPGRRISSRALVHNRWHTGRTPRCRK